MGPTINLIIFSFDSFIFLVFLLCSVLFGFVIIAVESAVESDKPVSVRVNQ